MMTWAQFNMLTPVQLTSSQWGDPCVFLALWMQESGFSCMSRAVSLWDLCQLREVTCGNSILFPRVSLRIPLAMSLF